MYRREALIAFLNENAAEMGKLYNEEMEVQVNVGRDGGEKVTQISEFAGGKKVTWWGYQGEDGEIWKPFRIPWNAKTADAAEYTDSELTYSTDHFEAIGLTGWNWIKKQSHWVSYDFDSIANHSQGLSDDDLSNIRTKTQEIDWITVRRSTSGKGLHLYVFFTFPIPTVSHTEHAALARAILSIISIRIGYQLKGKVDTCGGILWIWHRKQANNGFELIKEGTPLPEVPPNWQTHLDAVEGPKGKQKPPTTSDIDGQALEGLVDKTKCAKLDDTHRMLFGWLAENKRLWWWDQDRQLLVAHTYDLMEAHNALHFKGPFYTVALGKEKGNDQNCFGFPLRNGGWCIRRHTRKTPEHPAWSIDSAGWTRCYYNVPADLGTACRCHHGVERSDGRFEIPSIQEALIVLDDLGAPPLNMEGQNWLLVRPALMKQHKDGRVIIAAMANQADPQPQGWSRNSGWWEKIITVQTETPEIEVPDHFIRHTIYGGQEAFWFIYVRGEWVKEGVSSIKKALAANGMQFKIQEELLGHCVNNPWQLIIKPFQSEYPGNRTWNRNAPQFAVEPLHSSSLENDAPSWYKILTHLGRGLDDAVAYNEWCREVGIISGREYLIYWIASLFQFPSEPLPYLFFYGIQNSGKSILHEALRRLFKNGTGYIRADVALQSTSRFNAELINSVLCIVEETNLKASKDAYNRIKDWVTSPVMLIHEKGKTPFEMPNTTHWIQCSNEVEACPIFPGDTRITLVHVGEILEQPIPKSILIQSLETEGAYFLGYLMELQIPATNERLRVPVVASVEKMEIQAATDLPVNKFLEDRVYKCSGNAVTINELYTAFIGYLPIEQRRFWTYKRFSQAIPEGYIKGKWKSGSYSIANISLEPDTPPQIPLVRMYDRLVELT